MQIPNSVIRSPRLTDRAFRLLLALLKHGKPGVQSWPGVRCLCPETGMRPGALARATEDLERLAVLDVSRGGAESGEVNKYTVRPWAEWLGFSIGRAEGFVMVSFEVATGLPYLDSAALRLALLLRSFTQETLRTLEHLAIRKFTGWSRMKVIRTLKVLENWKVITCKRAPGRINEYDVPLDWLDNLIRLGVHSALIAESRGSLKIGAGVVPKSDHKPTTLETEYSYEKGVRGNFSDTSGESTEDRGHGIRLKTQSPGGSGTCLDIYASMIKRAVLEAAHGERRWRSQGEARSEVAEAQYYATALGYQRRSFADAMQTFGAYWNPAKFEARLRDWPGSARLHDALFDTYAAEYARWLTGANRMRDPYEKFMRPLLRAVA